MEFEKVGSAQIGLIAAGAAIFLLLPLAVAIIWKIRKKERFSTILTGALCFLIFAILLEKPLQNLLIFPEQMGLAGHALSRYINGRPVLWAFLVGLFPGVFEETGRLVAFRTVLRKRTNRETSISYGIGHGGFEVIFILGITYVTYLSYAFMINSGNFGAVAEQVAAQAPGQLEQVYALAAQLASFSPADLLIAAAERVFAFLFHVGASVLVFYACRDRKRFLLYPLAIVLHTALDSIAALNMAGVLKLSPVAIEGATAFFGCLTFFGAYFLLYRKDKGTV